MIIKTLKNSNYSIISNELARNSEVSIKAKGLYFYIMTLPETWEIHREELYRHFKEGRSSLDKAFNELIDLGYIIQNRKRNEDGSFGSIEYTVLESNNKNKPYIENADVVSPDMNNQELLGNDPKEEVITSNFLVDSEIILSTWNTFAKRFKLSEVSKITGDRYKKLKTRISEGMNFDNIISEIEKSKFLLGVNDREWKIDFDWLIKNETNWVKISEGRYNQQMHSKCNSDTLERKTEPHKEYGGIYED